MKLFLILVSYFSTFVYAAEWQHISWRAPLWTPQKINSAKFELMNLSLESIDSKDSGVLAAKKDLLKSRDEFIARSTQKISTAVIENSWLQTIYSKSGQAIFSTGDILNELPNSLLAEIQVMEKSNQALNYARKLVPAIQKASFIFPVKIEVTQRDKKFVPVWIVSFVTEKEDSVVEAKIFHSGDLAIIKEKGAGIDGRGVIYPKGPRASMLGEVPLRRLAGDGTLTGDMISVTSALNVPVLSPSLFFDFFKSDNRKFDQVQTYYYVDMALRWFKDNLGAELKTPLRVRVHVGKDGISSAAFYYQNGIFLGTGDGISYQNMLQDPSIVLHETSHAIIDAYAGLPADGEGGSFNEGFADFFTACMLDNPFIGEVSYLKGQYRRSLVNSLKVSDLGAGIYQNGSLISGTLWDIRNILGIDKASRIAFRTLVRLGSGAKFSDFPEAINLAIKGIVTDQELPMILDILQNRGWRIVDSH